MLSRNVNFVTYVILKVRYILWQCLHQLPLTWINCIRVSSLYRGFLPSKPKSDINDFGNSPKISNSLFNVTEFTSFPNNQVHVFANFSKQHILGLWLAEEPLNNELKGFWGHLTVEKRYRILSVTRFTKYCLKTISIPAL